MTRTETETKLAELEAALKENEVALDAIIDEFRVEVQPLAENWIQNFVLEAVENDPDRIQELGTERIQSLKADLNRLFGDMPRLVMHETRNRSDWPHHRPTVESEYQGKKNEPFFEKTFRGLISHVAPILHRFGLRQDYKGQLQQWVKNPNGDYQYGLLTGFEVMRVVSREHFQLKQQERDAIFAEIAECKKQMAKAKARELFESA